MGIIKVISILSLFVISDIFITLFSFAFYSPGFEFNFELVSKFVLWRNYSYLTDPSEFLLFAVIRILVICVGILMNLSFGTNFVRQLAVPLLGFFILTWTATLIKFLVYAENSDQLKFFGVWLSTIWNIIATALLFPIWYLIICSDFLAKYKIVETNGPPKSPSALKTAHLLIAKRYSTFEHAVRLLMYCKQQWQWFTAGFLFLLIYSLGKMLTICVFHCHTSSTSNYFLFFFYFKQNYFGSGWLR